MNKTTNMFFWKENDRIIFHTDLQVAADVDGLTRKPDKTITTEEWGQSGGLVRIIDDEIVLGKTNKEIEKEKLVIEERRLQKELAEKDYKVIKAAEKGLTLANEDLKLHERREWCRNRINEIREILK